MLHRMQPGAFLNKGHEKNITDLEAVTKRKNSQEEAPGTRRYSLHYDTHGGFIEPSHKPGREYASNPLGDFDQTEYWERDQKRFAVVEATLAPLTEASTDDSRHKPNNFDHLTSWHANTAQPIIERPIAPSKSCCHGCQIF